MGGEEPSERLGEKIHENLCLVTQTGKDNGY